MRKLFSLAAIVACLLMVGCAGTLPTESYTPQNIVRYEYKNSVDVGRFTYVPLADEKLKLKPNQVQNTAIGSMYIGTDVAELVRRATALELEKTGIMLNDQSPITVSGDVLELKADDLGYSVHWTYAIDYKIIDKTSGQSLYTHEYRPPMRKTGKFGLPSDYARIVHELVLDGYDMFIRDSAVRTALDKAPNITPEPVKKNSKK